MKQNTNSPEGLWEACEEVELTANRVLDEFLEPFKTPLKNCYEAGVQAPTLPGKRDKKEDISMAALFLKRTLTDLRSVWILLLTGYTSPAASVAASLFENALTVSTLAGSPQHSKQLKENKTGDIPWSPKKLSMNYAKRLQKKAIELGQPFDHNEFNKVWMEVYSTYKFLCKIKHPTLRSSVHDSNNTVVRDGEYVVMAAPDLRQDDLSLKAMIITMSINRTYEAIREFAYGKECDEKNEFYKDFEQRISSIDDSLMKTFDKFTYSKLPFSIADSDLTKQYSKLKNKMKFHK